MVDTAHRFQGDERDIILMSLVVTPHSSKRQFEFAMDAQLMNVSLTRAKQKLWIYSHPQNPNKESNAPRNFSNILKDQYKLPKQSIPYILSSRIQMYVILFSQQR